METPPFPDPEIKQIQILYPDQNTAIIIGLGTDNKMYAYDTEKEKWILFKLYGRFQTQQTRGYL